MASSAPKVAEAGRRDDPETVDRQAAALVKLIEKSKHFIAFTGAGVSTSTGIPDFRGPEGAWTLRAQGRQRTSKATSTLQAIPSPTHMALRELQDRGVLKYLVSQNCDGLHRRSGIFPDRISELHGNSNREYCRECGKDYIRGAFPTPCPGGLSLTLQDFRAVATYEKTVRDHRTGRKCALCGGVLLDSIINFGEALPERALEAAFENAEKADLCLVLGSSLTVSPANEVPEVTGRKRGAKVVICNLQSTPLDKQSHMRIYSETDELMRRVMEGLGFSIPKFILQRTLVIRSKTTCDKRQEITLSGLDVDATPVSFLQSVRLEDSRRVVRSEPFKFNLRETSSPGTLFKFELEFIGHYNEPNLVVAYNYPEDEGEEDMFSLEFDPNAGIWQTIKK